jgi:hypothetical protein
MKSVMTTNIKPSQIDPYGASKNGSISLSGKSRALPVVAPKLRARRLRRRRFEKC